MQSRKLVQVLRNPERHWVGDGFPVRTLFHYGLGALTTPFLLLDYAGPREFPATPERRGVGGHPHRGFETVTIVFAGEVEHRDSSGASGKIGPGDVQWMTAASGVVHEEFHGSEFARTGGLFEVAQLWVNLPARHKMSPPRYQAITSDRIPVVRLPDGQSSARVIAGELMGVKGPADTFTPVQVWDLRLEAGRTIDLTVPAGHTAAIAVLRGQIRVDGQSIGEAEVGFLERTGEGIRLETEKPTTALLLAGEPIDEPIAGQGPFVMNTPAEIRQAIADFTTGKMGRL